MLCMSMSILSDLDAQVSALGNNPPGGSYVGHMGSNGNAVEIRHNGNHPIEFYTDSIQRMRLYPSKTGTINGFTGQKQNGYVGISPQPLFFTGTVGPFSRLHLVDSCDNNANHYAQQYGFRPWMKNGITFTGNQDQSYIGQKYSGNNAANDSTDMVIQWSDNDDDSPWPTDRLRFLFTDAYSSGQPTGARSREGLESFRIFVPSDTEAFVGIGDWYKATVLNLGVMVDPAERLDVLNGHVRIRQLPTDPIMSTATKMVVVNTTGVLGWQNVPTGGGGSGCEWTQMVGGPFADDVFTATGTTPGCPDKDNSVGIGTNQASAKLHVVTDKVVDGSPAEGIRVSAKGDASGWTSGVIVGVEPSAGSTTPFQAGLDISVKNGTSSNMGITTVSQINGSTTCTQNFGVNASTANVGTGAVGTAYAVKGDALRTGTGAVTQNYAYYGRALGGVNDYGGYGLASGSATTITTHGFYGSASGGSSQNYGTRGVANALAGALAYGSYGNATSMGGSSFGAYGRASSVPGVGYGVYGVVSDTSDWAGYFVGKVYSPYGVWIPSDANLKQNIGELNEPLAVINALQPHTYDYSTDAFPSMNLPSGPQAGFLIQELETVLPGLVTNATQPAEYDSLGNVIIPAVEFKAMNPTGLIPYLVAGMKQQQAIIDAQNARLDAMEQTLSTCCSLMDDGSRATVPSSNTTAANAEEKSLMIQPNPFGDGTTITYTLTTPGQVRLIVSTSAGKQLSVLEEGTREGGTHTYEWNTVSMASGVYNVMLLVDGAPLVQKAIKITR